MISISNFFDAICCINLDSRADRWESVQKEFCRIWILEKVMRFSAIETPENGHIGCILSHRAIIEYAKSMWWKNVMVFEDDVQFLRQIDTIQDFLYGLKDLTYDGFYLGGLFDIKNKPSLPKVSRNIIKVSQLWCTFAICYHKSFYDVFLNDYPIASIEGVKFSKVFQKYRTIDDRLMIHQKNFTFLAPKWLICSQSASPSNIQKYLLHKHTIRIRWIVARYNILYISYKIYQYIKAIF